MLAAIIKRNPAPENKFTYLHGMLLCPNRNGDPFACKLLLQKETDVVVDLSDYESMIEIVCLEPTKLRDETDEAFSKREEYIGGLEERNILRLYEMKHLARL